MTCNNCESTENQIFINTRCYWSKIPLNSVVCRHCGLVFLHPRPDKQLGIDYFNNAYSNTAEFKNHSYYRDNELIFDRNKTRFEILKKIESPNQNVLDFGAGQGHFVKICKDNNWVASGTEQSHAAILAAKEQFGIELNSSLSDIKTKNFGVITLWDVIEHLENPKETLTQLTEYLHPNGYLVIETSNINSFDFLINKKKWSYWHLDHYFYYSNLTLKYLLNTIGFEIVNIGKTISDPIKKKEVNWRKYFNIMNYVRTLKVLYYKSSGKDISSRSLMTVVARRISTPSVDGYK